MKRKRLHAKKIAFLALITGLGLIAFLIESLLPPLFFPGAKIGLSNAFSLIALVLFGLPEALLVTTARTTLGSVFAGNPSQLLYSFTAGIACTLLSRALLCAIPKISLTCVSVVAAAAHNLVQLCVYCALSGTSLLFGYAPYLALIGAIAGAVVGLTVVYTLRGIPPARLRQICGDRPSTNRGESIV
ncbi:MAG: Gx transporter family protein [Candidatus Gallimonas sp.]